MIEAKLSEIRRRLLDLTRNNRLLNHRSQGRRTLQIVDEMAIEVYRLLVEEGRVMQFLSREEAPPEIRGSLPTEDAERSSTSAVGTASDEGERSSTALALAPLVGATSPASRHQDRNLQTLLSDEQLQTRLVDLAREARSAIEEQGCNILYITLGMVKWVEADTSSEISRAPLVFIPVELRRKTVNTRYAIQLFDDDIVSNASLAELCEREFHLDLPLFEAEKDQPGAYFARVETAISGMSGWQFTPEIHLGLFSFSKSLMYRDLDPRNWPEERRLTSNPLIHRLTGLGSADGADGEGIPDPSTLDEILKPSECFQIVDADSSQQAAILAAKLGVNLVIDGPPGTGKSQTITNIISECLADGRTVLFVSEKSAALEVVKRRLEKSGAGDFVLELHSRQASKKTVLSEINRALEKNAATVAVSPQIANDLEQVRNTLNAHHRELHEPLGALQISPFQAFSRAIGLSAAPEADCNIPSVLDWSAQQLGDANQLLQALGRRLERVGEPSTHPWRGVGLQSVGVKEKQRINKAIGDLASSIRGLTSVAAGLALILGRLAPTILRDCASHVAVAKLLLDVPSDMAGAVEDGWWDDASGELAGWIALGRQHRSLCHAWGATFRADAEGQDWQPIRNRRRARGRFFLRWLFPSWRSDGRIISSFALDGKLPPLDKQLELLEAMEQSSGLRKQIEESSSQYCARLGTVWRGVDGDWEMLALFAQKIAALRKLRDAGGADTANFRQLISAQDRGELATLTNSVDSEIGHVWAAWQEWLTAINSDESQWLKSDWNEADLAAVAARVEALGKQSELLDDWVDLRHAVRECSNSPFKAYVAWLFGQRGRAAHGAVTAAFNRQFYRLWAEEALAARPALRGFRGQDHQAIIAQFRNLDEKWIEATRYRLATILAARRPNPAGSANRQSKLGLVLAEVRKKTRHVPLRKLLTDAGEVVQAIKPCFMMSPLSVAQYLAPGGLTFDVVIFDEASQVEPADAYGAVARGSQLILVGDERQLPPTNFFDRVDREETAVADDAEIHAGDLESILSLGIVQLRHRCGLRWHYRSRHSSLIEFSNQKFYDGQLRIFPSPHTDSSEMGLAFRFIEGAIYQRGAGRYNLKEAQAVAAAVIEHSIAHPTLSVGVGTLNQPQQRAIEDEVERLLRASSDPRVEQYFSGQESRGEPYFVKNLENIQGDERDVIFLSIAVGKDSDGKMNQNFGALNRDGGWRRLNVLITRARERCVVFTSIRHDDIDLGKTQARGVVALKEFLYVAEHGRLKDAAVPGGGHDSDFEATVCRALQDRGWQVHSQVGCAGFAIDLAVVDPQSPGRYLLGIECDGATYHSSPTARDRDRLRQHVLEGLGWTINRIWSTDWFHRPDSVLQQLLARLKALKDVDASAAPARSTDQSAPPPPLTEKSHEASLPVSPQPRAPSIPESAGNGLPPGVERYEWRRSGLVVTGASLAETPPSELAAIIRKLVEVEGPIHKDELARACAEIFETKATARPREAVAHGARIAVASGWITDNGMFLRSCRQQTARIRYRGDDCPVTDPGLIPPEEFEAAVSLVLKQQFGLKFDALIEAVARTFGFARTGPKLKSAIEETIVVLDQRGEIRQDSSGFVTPVKADPS